MLSSLTEKCIAYETLDAVKNSEDVKAFINFIKENEPDKDVETIKSEIAEAQTLRELEAVFAEYFDYSWLTLTVEEI